MSQVKIEVLIQREDMTGVISSATKPSSKEDQSTLLSWPSGGLEQSAFALLQEAIHKEAMLCVLLQASHDPTFISWLQTAPEKEKQAALAKIAMGVRTSMQGVINRIADRAVSDSIDTLLG